jgi:hypothetical protein
LEERLGSEWVGIWDMCNISKDLWHLFCSYHLMGHLGGIDLWGGNEKEFEMCAMLKQRLWFLTHIYHLSGCFGRKKRLVKWGGIWGVPNVTKDIRGISPCLWPNSGFWCCVFLIFQITLITMWNFSFDGCHMRSCFHVGSESVHKRWSFSNLWWDSAYSQEGRDHGDRGCTICILLGTRPQQSSYSFVP